MKKIEGFKPMLAGALDDIYDLALPVYVSPKIDGIRCILIDGVAYSRTLKLIPNHYIQDTLSKLTYHQPKGHENPLGLDGELIIKGKSFNDITSEIMREDGEPDFTYVIFDAISNETYKDRYNSLLSISKDLNTKHTEILGRTYLIHSLEQFKIAENSFVTDGYEGIMIRSEYGIYKYGRSTVNQGYLLKYKRFLQDEALVIDIIEQQTNNNPKTKNELGHSKRSTHKANMTPANTLGALRVLFNGVQFDLGTGFNDDERLHIWLHRKEYINKTVTFKYQELSEDKVPRFPVWIGFRHEEDK